MWLALAGLISLVCASALLFVQQFGIVPRRFLRPDFAQRVRRCGRSSRRKAFLRVARRRLPVLSIEVGGAVLLLPTADKGIARRLASAARRPEFVVLDRAVRVLRPMGASLPGSVLVDVGANLGTTALPALTAHDFGRVFAIEPDPENAKHLRAAIALNALDERADVVQAAASDASGRARFGRGRTEAGAWSSGIGSILRASGEDAIEVDVVTVDDALRAHGVRVEDVGLVWVDAQGHEGQVLAGAEELIRRGVPLVVSLRPAKLRRSGGISSLVSAAARYDAMIDLRRPTLKATEAWRPQLQPVAAVDELIRKRRATDVLLLRSPPSAGAVADS
jgi:FkbM family methyltransferase